MKLKFIVILLFVGGIAGIVVLNSQRYPNLPIVAIANYGPHASLQASIDGINDALKEKGFIHGQNIQIEVADVAFDLALIPQMISQLRSHHPQVMIVIGTPIAQYAKQEVKDIPLVFNVVTDPVTAGLLRNANESEHNMTGASDQQNLGALLTVSKQILPKAERIGVLYATSEANDKALVDMLNKAATEQSMEVVAVPVDHAKEVPLRMQAFKNKVDFIYVGSSGAIQPTLPAIVSEADKMGIPIFNVYQDAVKAHRALASFGVDYYQVGGQAGSMVSRILQGESIASIKPSFPSALEHQGYISKVRAQQFGINLPENLIQFTVVD